MRTSTTGTLSPVDRFFEFSLLGLLSSGYLAVVGSGYLDTPTVVLTALALFLRALFVSGLIRYEISPNVVAVLTLAYMGFYPIDFQWISKAFLPATVHLVFFIACVKILTATSNRDYFFVKVIAFLELLAACVLSSSFNFFLFLALFLVLGVATFMSSEIRRAAQKLPSARSAPRGTVPRLMGVVSAVSIGILTITSLLFFLLPRTARAAFQHILQHRYHIAGFSNGISLGEIGEIKKQDTPVMHVRVGASGEQLGFVRWRGSALAQFDGHRWYNLPARGDVLHPDSRGQLWLGSWRRRKGLSYSVHLNDAAPDGVLFFAGSPQSLRIEAPVVVRTPVDSYRLIGGGYGGLNYQVFSYLDPNSSDPEGSVADPAPALLPPSLRQTYLQLPALDSRIFTLTRSISALKVTPEAKARSIEKYLRTSFGYTLDLPKTEPADPLANFLFERRKGHCEYFASAMTVMLRTIGIPSRVVTGFAGGMYNPISGWYVIRASDAHSWVEAYLPKLGWTTFDPTPPDPNPAKLSLVSKLGFYLDAAEVFWQDWVINYDLDRQLLLASRMEQGSRSFRSNWLEDWGNAAAPWKARAASVAPGYAAGLVSLGVFAFLLARFRRDAWGWISTTRRYRRVKRGDVEPRDATLLYNRMLKALKRRGIEKPSWLTPFEFARVLQEPELALLVEDITGAYNELRFGGDADAAARMMRLLGQLEALA